MFKCHEFLDYLTRVCDHYEKTAPTVSDYADDLYRRTSQAPETVILLEVLKITEIHNSESGWQQPNHAANRVYHLLQTLGRDTTGQAGF
jgi:hypothetical protein